MTLQIVGIRGENRVENTKKDVLLDPMKWDEGYNK